MRSAGKGGAFIESTSSTILDKRYWPALRRRTARNCNEVCEHGNIVILLLFCVIFILLRDRIDLPGFVKRERQATGEMVLGIFDLLYAPEAGVAPAGFLSRPLFARDVGDLIITAENEHVIAVSLSGGAKAGRRRSSRSCRIIANSLRHSARLMFPSMERLCFAM